MLANYKYYSLFNILLFFLLFVQQANAELSACSASVSSHELSPDSSTTVTIGVQNQSDSDATSIVINRPGGNYHLSSSGVDGCSLDQGDDSIRVHSCNLSPSQSLSIPIDVATDGEVGSESWSINISDNDGVSDIQCGGDLSSVIQGSSGGSSSFSISDIGVTGSDNSATISWTTDVDATSVIEYGTSDSYGSNQSSSSLVTSHSLSITSLSSTTTYHYRLTSVDANNNSVSTGDNTFTTSTVGGIESSRTSSTTSPSRVTPTPTLPPDITPPTAILSNNFSKPVSSKPTIIGSVEDDRGISRVDYSIDGGVNWYKTRFTRSQDQKAASFSFIPSLKEDGNYEVVVKATDTSGNTANSRKYILIFDRIPPKIGGSVITSGTQIVGVSSDGTISLPSHTKFIMLFSSIGGATKILLTARPYGENKAEPLVFEAKKKEDVGIWSTELKFDNSGDYEITAQAIDGADNKTQTRFTNMHVIKSGSILSKNKPVKDAKITIFYYQKERHSFQKWNGGAYSQVNPAITNKSGRYSFFLPKGTYYVEVNAPGYKKIISEIFTFEEATALNSDFVLTHNPFVAIGNLKVSIPVPLSDTQKVNLKEEAKIKKSGLGKGVIGKKLEQVKLVSDGKIVDREFFDGKKTILGLTNTWLPQTQGVIESLAARKSYQVAVVMPHETDSFIQTYKKKGGYGMPFIADKDGQFLETLGIRMLPAIVLVDDNGIVKELKIGVSSNE